MTQAESSPTRATSETSGRSGNQNPTSNASFSQEGQTHERWLTAMVCVLLAAMVWAVFGQTRHFDFTNYDDPTYVYNNPDVNQGLTWHGVVSVFTLQAHHELFPVTYISRMLDFQFYGPNAGGHHLTNVLLHAATAIALFLVLRRMTGRFWSSAFVAAVFAIHPLRAESVAWVVERKDVLSGLFFMLTLWAWLRYVKARAATEGAVFNYVLALIFFTLGLLSKSMLVTLPFVLLLLDYWPLKRFQPANWTEFLSERRIWVNLILEKIPLLLLSGVTCFTTAFAEKNVMQTAHGSPFAWRIGNALLAYNDYLKHSVYPVGLAVVYPFSEASPPMRSVWLAVAILSFITVVALAGWRKYPYLTVGWLWYIGMFLPVIVTMQATQNARADRYSYLPQIGLIFLVTWAAVEFCASSRRRRILLGGVAVTILASLMAGAHVQTTYWKDSVSLWTRSVACTSENYFAENSLGSALNNQDRWDDAVQHLKRSIQFKPDNIEAHVNLGVALMNQGKTKDAISQFEQTLQLNPHSIEAQYYLGDALATDDKLDEAIPHFEQALQFRPDYSDNNFNFTDAHYGLGLALARQHKWAEALPHFEQALHFKLDETDAKYILAVKLAARKKWSDAIELYQQVLQRKPDFAEAYNNYGVALASAGKSDEAAQQFHEALTLATAQGNTALADSIRIRLKSDQSVLPQPQKP